MGFWQKVVTPKVVEELKTFTYKPTIRGMFYYLASNKSGNVLENTFKQYKAFITAMGVARRNGTIEMDAFADDSRGIYNIDDDFRTPAQYVATRVWLLKNAHTRYFDSIPKWHKQEHYVEIWCEKAALRGLFVSIVESEKLQVRVIVNKGWSSMPYKQTNINRLLEKSKKGEKDSEGNSIEKQFHVLYFGDYDPTGRRMDMNIKLDLALANQGLKGAALEKKSKQLRKGFEEYEGEMKDLIDEAEDLELFTRVALTKSQISEYGLEGLENPDPKVLEKLEDDSNAQAFRDDNGGRLFQIEVDTLQKEESFKELVIESVMEEYFDDTIHDNMMNDYTEEQLKDEVRDQIVFLDDDPFPTYQPYLDEVKARRERELEEWYRDRHKRKREINRFYKRLDESNKRSSTNGKKKRTT